MGREMRLPSDMRRILTSLGLAGGVTVGAFAQVISPAPPADYQRSRQPEYALKTHIREEKFPVAASALDVQGPCKYSKDGKSFHPLKKDMQIPEHAVIRTGSSGTADLFLRRMGTTVRLKPDSEISLDRIKQKAKDDHHG